MKIDDSDHRIIDLLRKNGRITNNEIAAVLGVSEGTIRIRKMIEGGLRCCKSHHQSEYGYRKIINGLKIKAIRVNSVYTGLVVEIYRFRELR